MFGHIDSPAAWAEHFELLRAMQRRTGGFTEFVPLPFVHMGAPIYLQGRSRPGPTWDEVVLVHAVGRIALDGLIPNIQASWVKLGLAGGRAAPATPAATTSAGTLMDENISRASGAAHGQLATPEELEAAIRARRADPGPAQHLYDLTRGRRLGARRPRLGRLAAGPCAPQGVEHLLHPGELDPRRPAAAPRSRSSMSISCQSS